MQDAEMCGLSCCLIKFCSTTELIPMKWKLKFVLYYKSSGHKGNTSTTFNVHATRNTPTTLMSASLYKVGGNSNIPRTLEY